MLLRHRAVLAAGLLAAAGCSDGPDAPAPPTPSEARAVSEAKAMIPASEQPDQTPTSEETAAP